jgi:glucose dehydrogenase
VEVTLHEEVSMNRRGQKVMSGGIAASMLVFAVASANAQAAARTGAWTYGAAEGEWVMTGRDYGLSRFSPLKQITTANVANLKAAWSFSTGTLRGHEGQPARHRERDVCAHLVPEQGLRA